MMALLDSDPVIRFNYNDGNGDGNYAEMLPPPPEYSQPAQPHINSSSSCVLCICLSSAPGWFLFVTRTLTHAKCSVIIDGIKSVVF